MLEKNYSFPPPFFFSVSSTLVLKALLVGHFWFKAMTKDITGKGPHCFK